MDKAFWRSISTNNFEIPAGFQIEVLTEELVRKLGDPDPELRDYYIYTTLEHWIQEGHYTQTQLRNILAKLLLNMTQGLGTRGDDKVLLRSFSALALSEVIKYDNAHPFLSAEAIQNVLEQGINYLISEQDLRGYVEGKGWLHALAHAGDLLSVLTRSRYIGEFELERILTAVAEKITLPVDHVYVALEDERVALVIIGALTRKLVRQSFWRWWCQQLTKVEELLHWENTVHFARINDINAYHNTRSFLHSLYLQLTLAGYKLPGIQEFAETIVNTLYDLDPGFYSVEVIKIIDPEINTDELKS